jgi:hypothetical protein
VSSVQMFLDGGNHAALHLHVRLALDKSRKRLVEQALQGAYLLPYRTKATFEITLDLAPQTIFQLSVGHSSLLRVVVLF